MNKIQALIARVDSWQRKRPGINFIYAVIKKYGDDNAGYKAALVTYYGFLSLFPLLIVFTSLTQLLLKHDPALRDRVAASVTAYFPLIGDQLQEAIQSPKKTGLALAISLAIALFGARGGANAIQYCLSTLWHIPSTKNPPFPKAVIRSFGIIFGGGLGLIATTVLSGYTALLGQGMVVRAISFLVSVLLLWATFIVVFKLSIATHKSVRQAYVGAGVAALGIQVVQTAGTVLLSTQLANLDSAYGTFAVVLGLLYWIYLQAQVILYAVEIDVVRTYSLYPRGIQEPLTKADKRVARKKAEGEQKVEDEDIEVSFP